MPKKNESLDTILTVKGIPKELKRKFHSTCIQHGRNMSDVSIALVRVWLKRPAIIMGNTRDVINRLEKKHAEETE